MKFAVVCLLLLAFIFQINCRRHKVNLKKEKRCQIPLSTFGFYSGGFLNVSGCVQFTVDPKHLKADMFGFTLDRTDSAGISSYMETRQPTCVLKQQPSTNTDPRVDTTFFRFDFKDQKVTIDRKGKAFTNLQVTPGNESLSCKVKVREDVAETPLQGAHPVHQRRRRAALQHSRTRLGPRHAQPAALLPTPTQLKTATPAFPPESAANSPEQYQLRAPVVGRPPQVNSPVSTNRSTTVSSTAAAIKVLTAAVAPAEAGAVAPQSTDSPLQYSVPLERSARMFSFQFSVAIRSADEVGLYTLYLQNCWSKDPSNKGEMTFNAQINVTEKNAGSFLSAGEMPLPTLYFWLTLVFFALGCVWLAYLRKHRQKVFKVHWLMFGLVLMKCTAFTFHAMNYYFIGKEGIQEEAWAILYYITHLTKGVVLFITIILIGAGWTFIKHVLSDRDKKIFLVVIPLQILDNIAQIILDESEQSMWDYSTWKGIFILVDLLCCGAVLFPVVWSIRHLQEASHVDGKAAMNLQKLKLFRQFYTMIVVYIYFTRIVVYLLQVTVPFQYQWVDKLFMELGTLLFFVVTGYKFRPGGDNPYMQLPQSDLDDEEDVVLTRGGALETVVRVNVGNANNRNMTNRAASASGGGGVGAAESVALIKESETEEHIEMNRVPESSHQYD